MKYFYYTRWKFKVKPIDLYSVGPFHSTFISETPPKEFLNSVVLQDLDEFFVKTFADEQSMRDFFAFGSQRLIGVD